MLPHVSGLIIPIHPSFQRSQSQRPWEIPFTTTVRVALDENNETTKNSKEHQNWHIQLTYLDSYYQC